MDQQRKFSNALRILISIDFHEVSEVMTREEWPKFRNHPFEFFISASDKQQDFIWNIIEGRQTKELKG